MARSLLWLARIDGLDVGAAAEALPALLPRGGPGHRALTLRDSVSARLALGVATTVPDHPALADVWTAAGLCDQVAARLAHDGGLG